MNWLNEGVDLQNLNEDIEPQCLVNITGCLVKIFGVCLIVNELPIN